MSERPRQKLLQLALKSMKILASGCSACLVHPASTGCRSVTPTNLMAKLTSAMCHCLILSKGDRLLGKQEGKGLSGDWSCVLSLDEGLWLIQNSKYSRNKAPLYSVSLCRTHDSNFIEPCLSPNSPSRFFELRVFWSLVVANGHVSHFTHTHQQVNLSLETNCA